jgi:hypothetical protein
MAFFNCTSLTAITVDPYNPAYSSVDGVLFDKSQTTLIEYPGGKVGIYAIPSSVTIIGGEAFEGCANLTNFTISDSVTSIGDSAFRDCVNLTNVNIGKGVTIIGSWTFAYCASLTGLYFQGNAPSVGSYVFYNDNNAAVYYLQGATGWGATFGGLPTVLWNLPTQIPFTYTTNNGTITITGYTGSGGAVSIPSIITGLPVTSIGNSTFIYCSSLTSVTIPDSVTNIGNTAFCWCTNLTSVTIPSSVTSIGNAAFRCCTNLAMITVDPSNSTYSSVDGVLFDKSQTTLIQCPGGKVGSYTIPNSVTIVGNVAFEFCASLTSIMIGTNVTNIGDGAFACTSLTNVTIPGSVTSIGDNAFGGCTSLTSVTIPDSVTNIGAAAFCGCSSLTSVTIPSSVTSIPSQTFLSCTSMTSITIGNGTINIGDGAFYYCTNLSNVYFQSNAPSVGFEVFYLDNKATVYYLPGTTGWGTFHRSSGLPTVLWNPQAQTSGANSGALTNGFGLTITGNSNMIVVVEACTNLLSPTWYSLQTNTLTSGSSCFSDPQWTNYPGRFYRLRSP